MTTGEIAFVAYAKSLGVEITHPNLIPLAERDAWQAAADAVTMANRQVNIEVLRNLVTLADSVRKQIAEL